MTIQEEMLEMQRMQELEKLNKRFQYRTINGIIHIYDLEDNMKVVKRCKSNSGLVQWQMKVVAEKGLL